MNNTSQKHRDLITKHEEALAESQPAEQPRFLQVYNARGGVYTTNNPIHLTTVLVMRGWETGKYDRWDNWREHKTNRAGAGLEHARLKLDGDTISISMSGSVVGLGTKARDTLDSIAQQQGGCQ